MTVTHPTPLHQLDDPALAALAQRGDQRALETLLNRYRRFARAKSRGYFIVGGDADDLGQEALIGLYKAVRDFRPGHLASFRAFAELCITRQIISAIKTATRQKHQPLNQYVSTSSPASGRDDVGDRSEHETFALAMGGDPLDEVIAAEGVEAMRTAMRSTLSAFEVQVLELYVGGSSYQEIGVLLGRHVKSIDNAIQRTKRKLGQQRGAVPATELALSA